MSNVVIRNKVLINSNKKYFRTGAEKTLVGAYGKKEKVVLKSKYLFRHSELSFNNAAIQVYGPYELNTEKTKKADFDVPADTPVASGSANVTYEQMKSQELKFIELYISGAPLIDAINNDNEALSYLRSQGEIARIVDCVFVAIESEFHSKIDFNSDINATSTANGIEISVKLKVAIGMESSLKLAPKTTIAYGLVAPIWNNEKTKVIDLEPDLRGAG